MSTIQASLPAARPAIDERMGMAAEVMPAHLRHFGAHGKTDG
jgi:hypothetical protein